MPINYKTTLLKFAKKGEKTGWTYIDVPADLVNKLKRGNKKSFRVKGKLDEFKIAQIAILPMGDGEFIMPINAEMRKGIHKKEGAMVQVSLQEDTSEFVMNNDFVACLDDEKKANTYFKTLSASHQRYFSKWIESAKTEETKAKRIAMALNALSKGMGYPEMLRAEKANKSN